MTSVATELSVKADGGVRRLFSLLATPLRAHPYVAGAALASCLFVAATWRVQFPFMADDFANLVAAYTHDNLFLGFYANWLNRSPVWAVLVWPVFGAHAIERTWAIMYLFFALHAAAVALIARWLVREIRPAAAPPASVPGSPWIAMAATMVFALHPNTAEIIYWPMCMPSTVGSLLLAAGLYSRRALPRALLFAASFLTYETFILPALALSVVPAVAGAPLASAPAPSGGHPTWAERWPRLRAIAAAAAVFAAALAITLSARWLGSLGNTAYPHAISFDPAHLGQQVALAAKQLFQVRSYARGSHGLATAAQVVFLVGAVVLLPRGGRKSALWLLAACFVSTGAYWLLAYSATRAIYGSVLMLEAVCVWLAVRGYHGWRDRGVPVAVPAVAVLFVFIGYASQSYAILRDKDYNGRALAAQEAAFAPLLADCGARCRIEHGELDRGLARDWVLPQMFWPDYLEYLRRKHAAASKAEFVLVPGLVAPRLASAAAER